MASTRLKGNVVPVFYLSSLSSPVSGSFGDDLISIELTDGDGDQVTFSDFASGESAKALSITATYSGQSDSLYDVLWRDSGRTGVGFVWGPHGNSVAAADKPTFSGTLTLPAKPNLATEASASDPAEFEVEIQIDSISRNTV